jgi:DNA invertase Pin-like site-specific DNA recombinase
MTGTPRRLVVYARVSTADQTVQNQLNELRQYAVLRGWVIAQEFIDEGISGIKESRPGFDALLNNARRRQFDTLLVWSLDRVGRSLRHLVIVLDELQHAGVTLISLREGLDLSTAAGRFQTAVIAALAEFERSRLRERTLAGLARAKAQGKRLGRRPVRISAKDLARVSNLPVRQAARELGIAQGTLIRARREQCQ